MEPNEGHFGVKAAFTPTGEPALTVYCKLCQRVVGTFGGNEIKRHIETMYRYECENCDKPKAKA